MMPETKAFIEVSNSLLSLRESENHNETIVESCNRNLANRIGTFIKIIEAQDKEIERLKLKVEVAAEEEREACAKIADSVEWSPSAWDLNEVIADAIRARGEL